MKKVTNTLKTAKKPTDTKLKMANALFVVRLYNMHVSHLIMTNSKLEKCVKSAGGVILTPLVIEYFTSQNSCRVEMYLCMISMIVQKNMQNLNI